MTPPVCEYCRSNWTECLETLQQQYAEVERLGGQQDALLEAVENMQTENTRLRDQRDKLLEACEAALIRLDDDAANSGEPGRALDTRRRLQASIIAAQERP